MSKKVRRADIILIGILVVVGLVVLGVYSLNKTDGAYVVVTVDDEVEARYPLSEDITTDITFDDGEYNTLTIEGGFASITDSTCQDHLCQNMGRIDETGETIVCLPHKLVVSIESDDNDYDALVR